MCSELYIFVGTVVLQSMAHNSKPRCQLAEPSTSPKTRRLTDDDGVAEHSRNPLTPALEHAGPAELAEEDATSAEGDGVLEEDVEPSSSSEFVPV